MDASIVILLGIIVVMIVVVIIIFLLIRKKKNAMIQSKESGHRAYTQISVIQMKIKNKPEIQMPVKEIKKQEKKSTNFRPQCGNKKNKIKMK